MRLKLEVPQEVPEEVRDGKAETSLEVGEEDDIFSRTAYRGDLVLVGNPAFDIPGDAMRVLEPGDIFRVDLGSVPAATLVGLPGLLHLDLGFGFGLDFVVGIYVGGVFLRGHAGARVCRRGARSTRSRVCRLKTENREEEEAMRIKADSRKRGKMAKCWTQLERLPEH